MDKFLLFNQRMCVLDDSEMRRVILEEAYKSDFTIHPYQNLKENLWWPNMKKDIADFMARCIVCQQVKIEH